MRARAIVAVVLLVVASTLTWAALKRLSPPVHGVATPTLTPMAGAGVLSRVGLRIGSERAPFVVVEFADFQCPACSVVVATVDSLRRQYGDSLALVFRHLPLENLHLQARNAAIAAECAATQGRFDEMYHTLYRRQAALGHVPWRQFAREAKVPDLNAFDSCLVDSSPDRRIQRDLALAESLHLSATPSFVVGGVLMRGVPSRGLLDSLLHRPP